MENILLELAVENSFMKGRIKELESTDRKTYAGVVGGARSGQDSKEVPRRKETYSVMVKSKDPKEDGDKIREKVNKMDVDVKVENVRRNRSGGLIIETRSKEEIEMIKQVVKTNPNWSTEDVRRRGLRIILFDVPVYLWKWGIRFNFRRFSRSISKFSDFPHLISQCLDFIAEDFHARFQNIPMFDLRIPTLIH